MSRIGFRVSSVPLIIIIFGFFLTGAISFAGSVDPPQTGRTTCFDKSGNSIRCTGATRDRDIQAGVKASSPRFTDNGDGTVTDNLTGRIWLTKANCGGTKTSAAAKSFCRNLASGSCGLTDGSLTGFWKLPDKDELLSLADPTQSNPALPPGHPFVDVQLDEYWTDSLAPPVAVGINGNTYSYIVNMNNGMAFPRYKYEVKYLWPVRSELSEHFLCNSDISIHTSASDIFSSSGGDGSIFVATESMCTWMATESLSWVTITSGASGAGNGTVSYSVEANLSTSSRSGNITIADKTFTVTQDGGSLPHTKAIIVAGGGPYPGNNLWEATTMVANAAYAALVYQGFSKDDIYYLSPDGSDIDADDNGYNDDVAADATNSNLQYAIENWARDAVNLFVFLTDHGNEEKFLMRRNEHLYAADLDNWLDKTEAVIQGNVIFVYDACRSGSVLPLLTPVNGKERILISSTSTDQNALFADRGILSFGYLFWSRLLYGDSFYDSYVKAKDGILFAYPHRQTPLLNANGNGIFNEREDQNIARGIKIGDEIVSGDTIPTIGSVSPSTTIFAGRSTLVYANDVEDMDGIRRVWANILPPDFNSGSADNPVTELPSIEFYDVGGNRYEASYDGFSSKGVYHLTIFAADMAGNISLPKTTTIAYQCAPLDSTLSFTAPCLELDGIQFEVTFDYAGDGLNWVLSGYSGISGFSGCTLFDSAFNFTLPCLEYSGTQLEVKFNYSGHGLQWKLDSYKEE